MDLLVRTTRFMKILNKQKFICSDGDNLIHSIHLNEMGNAHPKLSAHPVKIYIFISTALPETLLPAVSYNNSKQRDPARKSKLQFYSKLARENYSPTVIVTSYLLTTATIKLTR